MLGHGRSTLGLVALVTILGQLDGGVALIPQRSNRLRNESIVKSGNDAGTMLVSPAGHADVAADAESASLATRHGPLPPENKEVTLLEAWPNLLMALLAGISTVLGSTVLWCLPEEGPPPSAMAFALSLAGGVMLTVSGEMLAHHHDEQQKSWWWYLLLFFGSGALCFLLCKLSGYLLRQSDGANKDEAAESPEEQAAFQRWRLSLLLFVALTAHNFPEGFAVAVSTLSSHQLGIMVCIAIALHNIPEGVALAVAAAAAGKTRWEAVRLTLYSGLAEPIGALCAILVLRSYITPEMMQGLLAIVAGVMCYIAVVELMPEAMSTGCYSCVVIGFMLGVVLMLVTHIVLDTAIPE
eukprot:TRINITY_DN6855_c0_g1_i1.p1 TRINITY_DN6855_c0_g1~~TRINITY_DN6855_c0_g1_i1.p1  ORF type:complete len:353 (-),score=67.87 TRINITY_DN6855_c0_g1_i1:111-1169(-)